jgi:translation initiation factor IF-2
MNNCAVFGNIAQYFDYMKNRRGRQGGLPVTSGRILRGRNVKLRKDKKNPGRKYCPEESCSL